MALFSVRYCLILSQIRKNSKIIVRIRRDFVVGVSMMYDKRLKKQDSIINVGGSEAERQSYAQHLL